MLSRPVPALCCDISMDPVVDAFRKFYQHAAEQLVWLLTLQAEWPV